MSDNTQIDVPRLESQLQVPSLSPMEALRAESSGTPLGDIAFDPKVHLDFGEPVKVTTMEELGFPKEIGISKVAVSQPFKLFSDEAVDYMRTEIFSDAVWKSSQYTSNLAALQLRGFAPK